MGKQLFRPGEAAEALGLSRTTVYALIARGELPAVRIGQSRRIRAVDLEKWIQGLRPAMDSTPTKEAGAS